MTEDWQYSKPHNRNVKYLHRYNFTHLEIAHYINRSLEPFDHHCSSKANFQ